MKTSKVSVAVVYVMSLMVLLNQTSIMILWCLLELNMVMMVSMMFFFNSKNEASLKAEVSMFYFFIQTYASLIMLILASENYLSTSWFTEIMFVTSITVKLGLFPFQNWMVGMSYSVGEQPFMVLMTFQKLPLMLVIFNNFNLSSTGMAIFSFIMGSILIYTSNSTKEMLIYSSIYSFMWMGWLALSSYGNFLLFYLLYSIHTLICLNYKKVYPELMLVVSFIFFLGLPPMSMFFFKLGVLQWAWETMTKVEMFMFWICSFVALFGYMKISKEFFIWKKISMKSSIAAPSVVALMFATFFL